MKNNNTHFEPSLSKHLDESISNVGGDDDLNIDGDSNIEGDYSNARGRFSRRGSFQGGRRSHINYVRRNLGYGYGYPYAVGVVPATALYLDASNDNTAPTPAISGDIKITKRGKKFLKKNSKGVNGIFLSYIKSGNRFDAAKLKKELQLKDFDKVVGFMNSQKLVEIIK